MGNVCTRLAKNDDIGYTALRKKELRKRRAEKKREEENNNLKLQKQGINSRRPHDVAYEHISIAPCHNGTFEVSQCDLCRNEYNDHLYNNVSKHSPQNSEGVNDGEQHCIVDANCSSEEKGDKKEGINVISESPPNTKINNRNDITFPLHTLTKLSRSLIDSVNLLRKEGDKESAGKEGSVKCRKCCRRARLDNLNRIRPPNIVIPLFLENDAIV